MHKEPLKAVANTRRPGHLFFAFPSSALMCISVFYRRLDLT